MALAMMLAMDRPPAVTVTDCEDMQTHWYVTSASRLGGAVWHDGPLTWTDGPDGQHLMFPRALPVDALARGIAHARDNGRPIVGAWLSRETDATALAECGFKRGWSPWWMAATLPLAPRPADPRVTLADAADGSSVEAEHRALMGAEAGDVWRATAVAGWRRRRVGSAWAIRSGQVAGVFDMEVDARHRRQGLGTGLLHSVCRAAQQDGVEVAVLNATPDGEKLYSANGFRSIGYGITWWLHLQV